MLAITNFVADGWETAIRGMRNPLNSWKMSDSIFGGEIPTKDYSKYIKLKTNVFLGEKDFDLMKRLHHAGSDHGKFMRMVYVSFDINAPLYW